MEKQKLPNVTIALVLGIVSFLACCCSSGIGEVILSGIALYLTNKDKVIYLENPELYDNYKQLNTARIIAIIGLVLAGLSLIFSIIYLISIGGIDAYMENIRMIQEQYSNQSI